MKRLIQRFKDISIARKLYFTVGLMALLIAIELAVLIFSIKSLSAIRTTITAEGLYSKTHKDAMYQLLKYHTTRNEKHYRDFLTYADLLISGHIAFEQLKNSTTNKEIAKSAAIQQKNHLDDQDVMYDMFIRFKNVVYIQRAIELWGNVDSVVLRTISLAADFHSEINSSQPSEDRIKQVWDRVEALSTIATRFEDEYSYKVGEGSRWMENLVLKVVFIVALTVELTGLILTIAVSRGIQKGLHELLQSSRAVAKGDFNKKAIIFSKDEIGVLATNFNAMADELQQSLRLMEAAQQRFKSLLDCAPDAMVILGPDGNIQLVNKQCENVFGYSKIELEGQKPTLLFSENYRNGLEENNVFAGRHVDKTDAFDMVCSRKSGSSFPAEISMRPIATEEGFLLSVAIRDISEKKQMENEIKEANINLEKKVSLRTAELQIKNRDLEQFAYVASHDLQEPLRTAAGFVTLLKKQYYGKLEGNADKYIDYVIKASDRMKILIMDLLDYSRLGREKELKQVDCNDVIREVLFDLQNVISENNARITVSDLPVVAGYATELKMLFQNLLSNSIKFRKKERNPLIEVCAWREKGYWHFSVKDNGIGIEKQYENKIFIIFQRLHNRSQYEGSGIGLAHCKKIVEMHRGNIWVESTYGEGSIFYFSINEN